MRAVLEARTQLGESPVWSVEQQRLFFVDIPGRRLHKFDPVTQAHEAFDVPEDIGCIAPAKAGGFIAGLRSGLWLLNATAQPIRQLAANPEDTQKSRFNDGRVDPAGGYVAGTIDETKSASSATLYRFDGRALVEIEKGLLTSNGVAFSPDGRTLYHSDTPRFVVYSRDFDPATGTVGARRVFAQLTPTETDRGRPDGAAVDVEGCYWSALFEGGRVQRYDPKGRLLAEYSVPAKRTTMPAFGGADLKTLFVTTGIDPNDGSGGQLFAMRVDVPGLPSRMYGP
jgi:sugar lactone lactonase YvrE